MNWLDTIIQGILLGGLYALFAAGLSVSEIAARHHRSIKTVSSHKISALRKLGLACDAELIEYARANGLAHRAMSTEPPRQPEGEAEYGLI